MVFERLVMETAEDISADGCRRQDTPNGSNTLQIPLAGVLTIHQFEDMIRTRLNGQMNELTEVLMTTDGFERLIGHILRMGSRKANTHIRNSLSHNLQQVREVHLGEVMGYR